MKSVHIVGRFPPPLDGQTLATRRLAELLSADRRVLTASTAMPEVGFVQTRVEFRWDRMAHYARLLPRLRRALAEAPEAPVLWPAVSPAPLGHWRDLALTLPAFRSGQPVFAVLHRHGLPDLFTHPLTRPTARALCRRMAGFVFLSERFSAECAPYIPEAKRWVIPNTIDEAVIPAAADVAARRADGGAGRPLRLLYLSNMMPEKGYADVLEAARLLAAEGAPVEAAFAGRWAQPEDAAAFAAYVGRHGLEGVVRHHGPLAARAEVARLHLWADVFLLPTYCLGEAQPLSIIEALSAGAAVITTRHGGIPEMVREGAEAFFVPPAAPQAIAEAVRRLAADAALRRRMSAAARARFEAAFSPEVVRRQWLRLIAPYG